MAKDKKVSAEEPKNVEEVVATAESGADLTVELTEVKKELAAAKQALSVSEGLHEVAEKKIAELQAKLEEAKKSATSPDLVVNGKKVKIVHTERVRDLVEMWRKRFVAEDALVLVVE